ncbi:uncharacterized protein NEMAJ01_0425 [Nematocida major]|uniref:uncharacterized protein n=1 Tax=Nematocida major TaxID=1912982 RepID=UPI002008E2B8|nr:uncharacterized protein NEMAJ01_0425 [Nematocida major]KAH9385529.1 hypothetical protein NEMAJ01_0425 [Nematocida major]
MEAAENARKDAAVDGMRGKTETTLEQIKKAGEDIIRQAQAMGKWITETAHATQRQHQQKKQQCMRREALLQDTLSQLKDENAKLLEERQQLAQETESEHEEVKTMKLAQQNMEERMRQAHMKKHGLETSLSQASSQVAQLRRALKQEEEREEKAREKVQKDVQRYSALLNMKISAVEDGSVLFLFRLEKSEHYFQITVSDTYSILSASVEEKAYKPFLEELESGHDLFLFVKQMKILFEGEHKKRQKTTEDQNREQPGT